MTMTACDGRSDFCGCDIPAQNTSEGEACLVAGVHGALSVGRSLLGHDGVGSLDRRAKKPRRNRGLQTLAPPTGNSHWLEPRASAQPKPRTELATTTSAHVLSRSGHTAALMSTKRAWPAHEAQNQMAEPECRCSDDSDFDVKFSGAVMRPAGHAVLQSVPLLFALLGGRARSGFLLQAQNIRGAEC
jgi:hypothetical protein